MRQRQEPRFSFARFGLSIMAGMFAASVLISHTQEWPGGTWTTAGLVVLTVLTACVAVMPDDGAE